MMKLLPLCQRIMLSVAILLPTFNAAAQSTDLCAEVVPVPLTEGGSLTFTGDNTAATSAGDFATTSPFLGASVVWHAFTTTTCMNITFDYCAQDPVWQQTWGFLFTDCPGTINSGPSSFTACDNGNTIYEHWSVPPGTYYIAVPQIEGSIGTYSINVTTTACPQLAENDLCSDAVPTVLLAGDTITFAGDNSLATGNGDFVPGDLEGAPVVWHAVTTTSCTYIQINYCGTDPAWTNTLGLMLLTCPGDPLNGAPAAWVDNSLCGDGNATFAFDLVPAGTYYIPVLRDEFNNSFGEYTLTVSATSCGVPDNDECSSVTPQELQIGNFLQFSGDNTGATDAGDFLPAHPNTAPVAWHSFSLLACSNVTVSYCGQDPVWANTLGWLTTTCPTDEVTFFTAITDTICGDGNTSYIYQDLPAGTYYVPILDDPFNNSSGPYQILVSAALCGPLSIEEVEVNNWTIHPNPADGAFRVSNGGNEVIRSLEVIDPAGRMIHRSGRSIGPQSSMDIDLSGIAAGVYVVRIFKGRDQRSEKLLIVR